MGEWEEYRLEDLGLLQRGRSRHRPRYAFHLYGGKYPFIQTGEIRESRKYIANYEKTYSEAGLAQSKIWPKGTLCITIAANIAELAILSFDACFPDSVLGFIPNEDLADLNFIYYTLTHFQKELKHVGEGSVQDNINLGTFQNVLFPVPTLPEQKAIASVLSSLDDKIDLLHRQNKTLEAMAETLFRQWFVEEAQDDWEEITLGECCHVITKGTTPTTLKKEFVTSGINFIKVNCIDENGNFLVDKFEFIDEETHELLSRSKLKEGDILYSIAGTIGRLIVVNNEVLPANVNQALAIIRVDKEKINPIFIKYCLRDREITGNLHSKVVHAVQPNLSLGEISNTILPFPPQNKLDLFIEIVEPIEVKLLKNKTQITSLEKLRDTLLPKILSGEVNVEIGASS